VRRLVERHDSTNQRQVDAPTNQRQVDAPTNQRQVAMAAVRNAASQATVNEANVEPKSFGDCFLLTSDIIE